MAESEEEQRDELLDKRYELRVKVEKLRSMMEELGIHNIYEQNRELKERKLELVESQRDGAGDAGHFLQNLQPPCAGRNETVFVEKFEKLLLESRFGLTIPELLELLAGEPVLTRQEQERRMNAEWKSLIEAVMEEVSAHHSVAELVMSWGRGLVDESSPGSRILRSIFVRSRDEARRCLYDCMLALNRVDEGKSGRPIRLPILAAEVTGDAHALDWKNPLGRLFWWGLVSCYGGQPVEMTEDTVVHPGELLPIAVRKLW